MYCDELLDAREIGLAGVRIGFLRSGESEEVFGRSHEEHRQRERNDVGRLSPGQMELDCHPTRIARPVVTSGGTGAV